ncbi:MAG: hypothetical protein R2705_02420 [Ilumatobacteraceae bacterium]
MPSPRARTTWRSGAERPDPGARPTATTAAASGRHTITITGEDFTEAVDNKAPKAKVSLPSATIGVGPITLSDAGSYDLDGDIASTSWTVDGIGDSTGRTSTITVSEVGTYTGVMTVADTREAPRRREVQVQDAARDHRRHDPAPTVRGIKGKNYASATVRVVDERRPGLRSEGVTQVDGGHGKSQLRDDRCGQDGPDQGGRSWATAAERST